MTRTADVPLREPVFHVLRENAPSSLGLLPGRLLPSAPFPCEAVDDSLGARHRIDSSRCSRQVARRREDRECRQTPCHRGAVSETFRALLRRTRVAVCGYVRIPLLRPAVAQANGPSQNPLPAAGFPRLMPDPLCTRLSRSRDAVCGSVRIQAGPHPSRKDTRP